MDKGSCDSEGEAVSAEDVHRCDLEGGAVTDGAVDYRVAEQQVEADLGSHWYAVQTRANHEKKIALVLEQKGITSFVPTVTEVHRWSDRRQVLEVPLFLCYVFVKVMSWQQVHGQVLRTPGLLRWVGANGEPAAIPDSQIEAVRSTLANNFGVSSYPFLRVGQRVRVRGGCLDGIEGILVSKDDHSRLVVSIDLIQKSLAVSVTGYDLEPVS